MKKNETVVDNDGVLRLNENIEEGLDHKDLQIYFKENNFQIIENIDINQMNQKNQHNFYRQRISNQGNHEL